jgi:hypothetical protein
MMKAVRAVAASGESKIDTSKTFADTTSRWPTAAKAVDFRFWRS